MKLSDLTPVKDIKGGVYETVMTITAEPLVTVATLGFLAQIGATIINGVFARRDSKKLKDISQSTHSIVNSQRSAMLRLIASLSDRIAKENPSDQRAQLDAISANLDSEISDKVKR